jgi:MoxR-like ATPase
MSLNRYKGTGIAPDGSDCRYRAAPDLVKVVNMAIHLQRPLLVKGPPGCGKTRLASAIARELGINLHTWYVKSTSRARDGLYRIDLVKRLQDAQVKGSEKAQKLSPYLRLEPLGQAIASKAECVVLIDEIDKADIDFPNDLLRELDEKKFTIDELDPAEAKDGLFEKTYETSNPPIIVITSNDEKQLPDAFLRRCLFHYIDFPKESELTSIVEVNTQDLRVDKELIAEAVRQLKRLQNVKLQKRPGTSELIDWVNILHHWKVDLEELRKAKPLAKLPHWQVMIKHRGGMNERGRRSSARRFRGAPAARVSSRRLGVHRGLARAVRRHRRRLATRPHTCLSRPLGQVPRGSGDRRGNTQPVSARSDRGTAAATARRGC